MSFVCKMPKRKHPIRRPPAHKHLERMIARWTMRSEERAAIRALALGLLP